MQTHYLEIVTKDVDGVCATYEQLHGVSFSAPEARLGNARTSMRLTQISSCSIAAKGAPAK